MNTYSRIQYSCRVGFIGCGKIVVMQSERLSVKLSFMYKDDLESCHADDKIICKVVSYVQG